MGQFENIYNHYFAQMFHCYELVFQVSDVAHGPLVIYSFTLKISDSFGSTMAPMSLEFLKSNAPYKSRLFEIFIYFYCT